MTMALPVGSQKKPFRRSSTPALLFTLLASGLASSALAQADAGTDAPLFETVAEFESHDPFARDPSEDELGGPIDPMSVGADDDPALALPPPTEDELLEPPVRVTHGAVLEAIAGVRATEHHTEIQLGHGLMVVEETLHFTSSARHRAEVLYRLAVPSDAHLVSLRVCNDTGCRDGLSEARASGEGAYDDALLLRSDAPSGLPVAHVARRTEGATAVLALRAAPIVREREVIVTVRWVAATPLHGSAVRAVLPSLGADPRVPERMVRLIADDLVEPTLDGTLFEAGDAPRPVPLTQPLRIGALSPRSASTDQLEAWVTPCGEGRCVRIRATAPRPAPSPRTLVLALDASPSTTIGARGRIADAVRVLVGGLREGSRVLPYVFAARAEALASAPVEPSALDLDRVRNAVSQDLGASTRFEALVLALREAGQLTRGTEIVVIGDGGITSSPGGFEVWAQLRELDITVSSVNVADRSTSLALATAIEETGGIVIDAGAEAASAASAHGDEALAERIAVLSNVRGRSVSIPGRAGGILRDGEELVFEGPLEERTLTVRVGALSVRTRSPEEPFLSALRARLEHRSRLVAVDPRDVRTESGGCADDGARRSRPTRIASAVLGQGRARVALAERRSCTLPVPPPPERARSLPSRPLLTQLRRRVIPVARGCFRDDRRGRADYSTRADIHVTFADREIVTTEVEGPITPALSACLAAAFDGLDIPAFDGTVIVHWPLYTAAEPPPPTLELAPDISRAVDRIGIE